jgi:hypothetical protein
MSCLRWVQLGVVGLRQYPGYPDQLGVERAMRSWMSSHEHPDDGHRSQATRLCHAQASRLKRLRCTQTHGAARSPSSGLDTAPTRSFEAKRAILIEAQELGGGWAITERVPLQVPAPCLSCFPW